MSRFGNKLVVINYPELRKFVFQDNLEELSKEELLVEYKHTKEISVGTVAVFGQNIINGGIAKVNFHKAIFDEIQESLMTYIKDISLELTERLANEDNPFSLPDEVFVLLEDSDATTFSKPTPTGEIVLTEREAEEFVRKQYQGYTREYKRTKLENGKY